MHIDLERQYRVFEREWFWFAARRHLIKGLLKRWDTPANLLDMGCGSGDMSRALASSPTSYCGIDFSINAIESGRSRENNNLVVGDIVHLPFSSSSFDTVLLLDVLEHIDSEVQVLDEIHRILRVEGRLVILVPAFNFLWGPHDVLNGHRRRYIRKQITELVASAGFELRMTSYWNASLFVPGVIWKKVKSLFVRRGQEKSDFVKLPTAVNRALTAILQIENFLILKGVIFPFGTSVFCVAIKKSKPLL